MLCNKTLAMFGYLSSDEKIRKLFLLPDMVGRLCSMLLHVMTKLVGSKSVDIKVQNPEKYNFQPKVMLKDLTSIFCNFVGYDTFYSEVASSGYFKNSPRILEKCGTTCNKLAILSSSEIENFSEIVKQVNAKDGDDDMDEITADAPDEFLDPVTCELMLDPVKLPSSGTVVDRKTIRQQLMNDPVDPFSRASLKIEDVIGQDDLKESIEEFISEWRAKKMSMG